MCAEARREARDSDPPPPAWPRLTPPTLETLLECAALLGPLLDPPPPPLLLLPLPAGCMVPEDAHAGCCSCCCLWCAGGGLAPPPPPPPPPPASMAAATAARPLPAAEVRRSAAAPPTGERDLTPAAAAAAAAAGMDTSGALGTTPHRRSCACSSLTVATSSRMVFSPARAAASLSLRRAASSALLRRARSRSVLSSASRPSMRAGALAASPARRSKLCCRERDSVASWRLSSCRRAMRASFSRLCGKGGWEGGGVREGGGGGEQAPVGQETTAKKSAEKKINSAPEGAPLKFFRGSCLQACMCSHHPHLSPQHTHTRTHDTPHMATHFSTHVLASSAVTLPATLSAARRCFSASHSALAALSLRSTALLLLSFAASSTV